MDQDCSDIFDFYDDQHCHDQEWEELFETKHDSDAKLKVGDQTFKVHKIILSASSPVFRALLSERWTQSDEYEIGSEFIDPEITNDLLCYIYTGRAILTLFNAHSICVAAQYLDLPLLRAASEEYLGGKLVTSNFLSLLKISVEHQLENLQKIICKFVHQNHVKIFQSSEMLTVSSNDLKMLFDAIGTDNNVVKLNQFYFFARWVMEDVKERENALEILCDSIPLWALCLSSSNSKVVNHPLASHSPVYSTYLNKVLLQFFDRLPQIAEPADNEANQLFCFLQFIERDVNDWWIIKPDRLYSTFYDLTTKQHTCFNRTLIYRSGFALTNFESTIYIAGGTSLERQKFKTFQKFCLQINNWMPLEELPFEHEHFAMATLDGYIYVSGGRDWSTSQASPALFRYCPITNQWHSMASMNKPRANHRMLAVKGRLYAVGGELEKTVEKYNPRFDEWVFVRSMDHSLGTFDATVFRNDIYLYHQRGLLEYSPTTDAWRILKAPVEDPEQLEDESKLVPLEDGLFLIDCHRGRHDSKSRMFEFDIFLQDFIRCSDKDIDRYHELLRNENVIGFYPFFGSMH